MWRLIMYSKEEQLKTTKNKSPKKMPKIEYEIYVDFVNCISRGMCQANCGRPAQDIHHSHFGAGGRDDRYLTAICRDCHYAIHHGTNTDVGSRLKLLFKAIGKTNWRAYNE